MLTPPSTVVAKSVTEGAFCHDDKSAFYVRTKEKGSQFFIIYEESSSDRGREPKL